MEQVSEVSNYSSPYNEIDQLKRSVERLAGLQAVTQALAGAMTAQEVAQVVIEQGVQLFKSRYGALLRRITETEELEIIAASGYGSNKLQKWQRFSLAQVTLHGDAVNSGKIMLVESRNEFIQKYPHLLPDITKFEIEAAVSIPLLVQGQVIGAIGLSFPTPQHFDNEDTRLMLTLGQQCAQALQRVRLYDELQIALRRQEEAVALQNTLIREAPVGWGFWDREMRFVQVNPYLARLNNASIEAHLGHRPREVTPRLAEIIEPHFRQVLETGQPIVNLEISGPASVEPILRRHALVSYYPVQASDGRVLGVGVIVVDATERKRAEDERQALLDREQAARSEAENSRNKLAFLAQASQTLASSLVDYRHSLQTLAEQAVALIADGCSINLLNPENQLERVGLAVQARPELQELARRLLNYPPTRPAHPAQLVLKTGQPKITRLIDEEFLQNVAHDEAEVEINRQLQVKASLTVPIKNQGQIKGALNLVRFADSRQDFDEKDLELAQDLANRIGLALENVRLYQEAQKAIRDREEFLSVAAHELKTPITGLKGFAQLLTSEFERKQTPNPERIRKALTAITNQSDKLTRLVGQLLDVSRIQAGRLSLQKETVDLTELVESVVALAQSTTNQHTISVRASAEPLLLQADPLRLEQVVTNLVNNAIKYSPEGGPVEIGLARPDSNHICLSVTDRGLGISLEHRAHIFDRFYQAHSQQLRGGMGLGLNIVHEIVQLHGGQIEAQFPAEGGTRFVVTLPVSE